MARSSRLNLLLSLILASTALSAIPVRAEQRDFGEVDSYISGLLSL